MASPVDQRTLEQVVSFEDQGSENLLRLYIEDTLDTLNQMERAVNDHSCDSVHRLAHTALGASQMLGMSAVADVLKQLERLAAQRDLSRAAALVEHGRREVGRTQDYLQTLVLNKKKGLEC